MKTIQINQCTQEELEWLPGVGPATAKKIVEARPIEAKTELEQIVPPSAWLKIQEAEVEFAFGADGEEEIIEVPEGASLTLRQNEVLANVTVKAVPVEPPITLLQEPEPLTLRRVLPGQELKAGASYICVWNMRWAQDGQARVPADEPVQKEVAEQLAKYGIDISFAHYGASVRVRTPSRGPVPLVLFEIIKETDNAEEDKGNRQRDGQGD